MDWEGGMTRIFDAHLHLSRETRSKHPSARLSGGLAISRSAAENQFYVQAARRLGLKCAVFVGGSQRELDRVVRLIHEERACAYDHLELGERFDAGAFDQVCDASVQAGTPLVVHVNGHDHRRTDPGLVDACLGYVAENFPQLKTVVAHAAGENCGIAIHHARLNPNLFLDISRASETARRVGKFSATDLLRGMAEVIPAARFIFGTDQLGPGDPAASIEYEAACNVFLGEERCQVLADNALGLFTA
jgi:predicted TIM-barrel fold metal-dependent hydrolase